MNVCMERICKSYGSVHANVDVDFTVRPGEVHALLGENGAGKSTLMGILFGLISPDSGRLVLDDAEARFSSPADALRLGIGMVHQHFMLVPTLTVAENIAIGSMPSTNLSFRRKRIEEEVAAVAAEHDLDVDPRAVVRDLPVEDQQRVEIVRLLYRGAHTLILDEPTAALGSAQIEALLKTLKDLQSSGHSIVVVTHKLDEVMEIGDRATVMKDGRLVAEFERHQFERRVFAEAMFDEIPPERHRARQPDHSSRPRLQISGLEVSSSAGRKTVKGLNLGIQPGEIVGLAGVAGNGQAEVLEALAGVAPIDAGQVELDGDDITSSSPLARHGMGISIVPEDRHRMGLVLHMSIAENLALTKVPSGEATRRGLVRRRQVIAEAEELIERFDIRPRDPSRIVAQLSGGNQQKVVMARELARVPSVLIAASPTRGLDISAAAGIHRQIEHAADAGCAVLVISPDLDEIMQLSDRVAAIFRGEIVYEVERSDASSDSLGLAMVGHHNASAGGVAQGAEA